MARVRIVIEGDGTPLDPADPVPFIAAAGDRFVASDDGMVLVRAGDGSVQAARAGWVAVKTDAGVVFVTPDLAVPA